ncbi:hypothetical protein [Paludisphaera borealis]|uniref:hypothetical protein n=1 Tax=Paludisphaera borealis TaxID=1387353 RepID=UPI0011AB446B|nr:hypothetical protein [Paludisphaera borealis]
MVAVAQAVAVIGGGHRIDRLAKPVQRFTLSEGAVGDGDFRLDRLKDSSGDFSLFVHGKPGQRPLNHLPLLMCNDINPLVQTLLIEHRIPQSARLAKQAKCLRA